MNKTIKNFRIYGMGMGLILCMCRLHGWAQDSTNYAVSCGTDANYILTGAQPLDSGSMYGPLAPITPFDSSAIMTCGKFAAYFQDVNRHFHVGFDDTAVAGSTTVGAQRRAIVCDVLTYIQSVYDFSNIPSSNPIRLLFDTSLDQLFHGNESTPYYAKATPAYDTTTNGIKKGWICDYTNGTFGVGVDPAPGHYHGLLQVNFDSIYVLGNPSTPIVYWLNYPDSICGKVADLFSILLHEVGHTMGFISFITFTGEGPGPMGLAPYPTQTTHPHIFSALDWSMTVGNNSYPLSLTRLLTGTTALPTLDSSNPLFRSNGNYWVNDSAAPRNLPLFSGIYEGGPGGVNSYLSHSDGMLFSYSFRERISDGDQESYLMRPTWILGTMQRTYAKGELQTFVDVLGYHLTPSFVSAHPYLYSNHRTFSTKMAHYPITTANYGYFTEEVTPDTTITNNIGTSITISIPAMVASGAITDGDAGDLGNIYADSTTLINFRGCGIGGNNHAALSMSANSKYITYTPRPNFYGKAQFGFNVTDGKEDGSYVVMTVDVRKGTNVSAAPGTNLVCNPGFEEGSEVRDSAQPFIPNSVNTNVLNEGKWQGINFSDSHPYCFYSNYTYVNFYQAASGIVVSGSASESGCSGGAYGNEFLTCPLNDSIFGIIDNPLPAGDSGARYQNFMDTGGSYYYLADSAKHCHRYILEFDLHGSYYSIPNLPLQIGFADSLATIRLADAATTFNFELDTTIPLAIDTWAHIIIPISYCGTKSSNILYLGNNAGRLFSLDNLSLKEDTTAFPLLVTTTEEAIGGCKTRLTAHVADSLCSVSYLWSVTAETTLNAGNDTVASNVTATYTVSVSDGCRDTTQTATITEIHPSAITGLANVCAGSTIALSDSVAGGTWASSATATATVDMLTGTVTGVTTGTAHLYYITYCRDTAAYTVTVTAPPTISGEDSLCAGLTVALTDAIGGGAWSSTNTAVATIGVTSGDVAGMSAGTAVISYTKSASCWALRTMTVNTLPHLGAAYITNMCIGGSNIADYPYGVYSSDPTTGEGTWTVSSTAIATLAPPTSGIYVVTVVGASAGVATLTYSVTNMCGTSITTVPVTVNPLPAAITGASTVCLGSSITVHDATTGGTWSTNDETIATIDSTTGIITGVAAGSTIITYTNSITGCFIVDTITVNALPPTITGVTTVCSGATTTLSDGPGGTWSSSNTTIASAGASTGIVTGGTAGIVTITYEATTGCRTSAAVSVITLPGPIAGNLPICAGSTVTVIDGTLGGTWSSGATSVATIGASSGVVTGVASGTTTLTYTAATGCHITATEVIEPLPAAIMGGPGTCLGTTVTLSDATTSGTWSSSATGVATIDSAGDVTGVTLGTAVITYMLPTGCSITTDITVNTTPGPITGDTIVCGTGVTISLGDPTPGGAWSSSYGSVATVDATSGAVTTVGAGTTIINYTLPGGCTATTHVLVDFGAVPCSVCALFGGTAYDYFGLSGTISADVVAGNYLMINNVTISGNVTMTDAIIFIDNIFSAPYHIYVSPGSSLTLKGCHLFDCDLTWGGIVLQSDSVQTGTVTLTGDSTLQSTLIEDAVVPVDVESPVTPAGGARYFVASTNTVFNGNDTGIKIVNYSPASAGPYPFLIEYTAFTSRKLWSGNPATWANYFDLTGYTYLGDYAAPYNAVSYPYTPCNNYSRTLQTMGVFLNDIGQRTYPNYAGVVVGDSLRGAFNLFDTLNYGIRAVNANVTVHNNVFAHMIAQPHGQGAWAPDYGGLGVYASMNDGRQYQLTVEQARNEGASYGGVSGSLYYVPNNFYNCRMAVAGLNYNDVTGTGSYMITTQDNTTTTNSGNYGYNLQSAYSHSVNVSSNTIINVANGIAYKQVAGTAGTLSLAIGGPGTTTINLNTIQATIPGGALTTQYVDKPIWVDNVIVWSHIAGLPRSPVTTMATNGNVINNAYNGIYINGVGSQQASSDGNTVNMMEYPFDTGAQYGIEHALCTDDVIGHNTMTGTDYNNDNWNGVLVNSSSMHNVVCNEVATVGRGIEIDGTVLTSVFGGNTMINDGKGFVLGGIIGTQGNHIFPSFNRWEGSIWSLAYPQTFTQYGADPTASTLWVLPGLDDDPIYNLTSAHISPCTQTYGCVSGITAGSGNGLIVGPYPPSFEEFYCSTHYNISPKLNQFAQLARQRLRTPRPSLDYWMSQYAMWEMMTQNDTLGDTSAVLDSFRSMAANSRFWLLYQIESDLANGDVTDAQALLNNYPIDSLANSQNDTLTGVQMADSIAADVIVNNYRQFYQLYINFLNNSLSSSDSAEVTAMANLCPITNGGIVFKARALYDVLFDTLRLFPSNCTDSIVRADSIAGRHAAPTGITSTGDNMGQQYTLFPNPNDGNFELQQAVADNAPVQVEIWDAEGQRIYNYRLQFSNAISKLNVRNVAAGLYLLQVTDSGGRMFKFKFVVE